MRQRYGTHQNGGCVCHPENCPGYQSHYYQAVFDVIACLQRVVPVVEYLSDRAAKAN
jgi:hypothetical protein